MLMNMKNVHGKRKSSLSNRLPVLWKQYWVAHKYSCLDQISLAFISFQASKSQQKHRMIQHAAGGALVKLFILSAVKEKRKSHRERRRLLQILHIKNFFLFLIPAHWKDKQGVTLLRWNTRQVFNSEETGMLVLQISDPCPSAKPKQIPFQTAHLHGSSLSLLLSQLKALEIWGRVRVRFKFTVIGIHWASHFNKMKTCQLHYA